VVLTLDESFQIQEEFFGEHGKTPSRNDRSGNGRETTAGRVPSWAILPGSRFRPLSPLSENGFVEGPQDFVAFSSMKSVHALACAGLPNCRNGSAIRTHPAKARAICLAFRLRA
jgi:hypothetical protein